MQYKIGVLLCLLVLLDPVTCNRGRAAVRQLHAGEDKRGEKTCMACTVAMGTAVSTIKSLVNYGALGKLSEYCDKVQSKNAQKMCKKFSDEDAGTLMEMIGSFLEPSLFCSLVGACE
ncbi:uncharacterized protein LOC142355122 isoform X2 [Convolutriloba macropyga]|uniref:uncharacterized protein LOC142355122 isoform X2 n=1 Tax=Convolutriloba macropyga TaxID=536237 RepID=UPI003F521960